ncbi:hypothetical protein CRYUN_Cryun22dG0127500 [Craigia yunnanensis]
MLTFMLVKGSIKPLPEAVRSTVRSAIILYDLIRVVEELIFNSLDAAASKVSVFVSVGSSYVKDLVYLGMDWCHWEKDKVSSVIYVFILPFVQMCFLTNSNACFCAHYTTWVIWMLPEGALASGRGEALASISDIALVEIVTKAYGKPNGYREVTKGSNCLYLGIDDDRKDVGRTGYISGSSDSFALRPFNTYVSTEYLRPMVDPEKANNWTKKGKRSRSQVYPSYIVNISCLPYFYDLTFEPSKTYVEFEDWEPILTLIEKAIQHLWRKNITCADGLGQAETWNEDGNILYIAEDIFDGPSVDLEFAIRNRTLKYQLSSTLAKLTVDHLFLMDHEDIPFEECRGNNAQFEDHQNDTKFVHWTDCSFQSWDDSLAKGTSSVAVFFLLIIMNFAVTQFGKNISKTFLQNCSSQRNWPLDRELVKSEGGIESPIDSFKIKKKPVCSNERFNMLEVDFSSRTFDHLSKTMSQDGEVCARIYIPNL